MSGSNKTITIKNQHLFIALLAKMWFQMSQSVTFKITIIQEFVTQILSHTSVRLDRERPQNLDAQQRRAVQL